MHPNQNRKENNCLPCRFFIYKQIFGRDTEVKWPRREDNGIVNKEILINVVRDNALQFSDLFKMPGEFLIFVPFL